MLPPSSNLRCFVPAKDFNRSRDFYKYLGFLETWNNNDLALFSVNDFSFYLQNFYAKDLAENFMIFLEVESADEWWQHFNALDLPAVFPEIKLKAPKDYEWGIREIHLIDLSGVLWHIGEFLN